MTTYRITAEKDNKVVKEFGDVEDMDGAYLRIQELDGPDAMENPRWPEDTIPVVTNLDTGERWALQMDAWEELPKVTGVAPKILIMRQHYWGKAETIPEAWKQLSKVSGYTQRQLKKDPWVMYHGTDTDQIPFYVNEMGSVCHHADYPIHEIDNHLPKKK